MRLGTLVVAAAALLASAFPASAEVQLTMANGQVTLSAKNATPSQILAEWARVGNSKIVNGERVTGAPLTIELTNVSEAQALDVILRGVGGYVLAPRPEVVPTASRYDRIFIVMATTPARPAPAAPQVPQRIVQQPPPLPEPDQDIPEQPRPAPPNPFAGRGLGQADVAPGTYTPFPAASAPRGVPQPSPGAGSGVGVAVPGMATPAPQPQQQQQAPNGAPGSPQ